VKDSENQNTIKLHADGNITCNNYLYKPENKEIPLIFQLENGKRKKMF
jgi:prolyl-tRNA synthetase